MNYSHVERDNIARGNRKAIEILFVLVKIQLCNFNNSYQIAINFFPFYLRDLEERGPNQQTFDTTRIKRLYN